MAEWKYRNELKYLITENELQIIHQRLKDLMEIDPHCRNGSYQIRSLYLDDLGNRGFFDVDDGLDEKNKFRIRIYDGNDALIRLECKHKRRSLSAKKSCILSRQEADQLIKGSYVRDSDKELLQKLNAHIMMDRYHPVVIVEYERIPFVYPHGNVRITLDQNISASTDTESFFIDPAFRRPILPAGNHLLEVKYDEYLPEHLFCCLNDLNLQQISFSKYYLCRKYNGNGGLLL